MLTAGQHAQIVFLAQPLEEALHLLGRHPRVRVYDDENATVPDPVGDVGQARQGDDLVVD